ncbi:DMT family transporter [Shimazuella alba]|uniref:EamA family transporter n=1 Tax=Shimazuella alba TaxID=2690964 RepID=A0A6I4VRZ0_9BACL|nr:DMT family transporter [Shimazuella alba]MXQ53005.1 EamA family transporter [Shimazuella alba]
MEKFILHPLGFITAILIITLLWGSPAPLIKLSYGWLAIDQHDFSKELLFAGYRFLLSAIILYFILRLTSKKKIFQKTAFRSLSKVGFVQNFLQYVFFYIGVNLASSMVTVILTGTASLFQILIAHFIDQDDRLTLRKTAGILIGFLGIFVVSLHSVTTGVSFGIGEILLLISNLAAAAGNLMARGQSAKFDIGIITFYQLFIGSICLISVGVWKAGLFPFSFDIQSGITFVYLALVALIGTFGWNTLLRYHPVSKASIFLFLIPVFGVFYSAIFLAEKLTLFTFLGLVLVCIGIVVVNVNIKLRKKQIAPEI